MQYRKRTGVVVLIVAVSASLLNAAVIFDQRKARIVDAVSVMEIPSNLKYIRYADAALQKAAALYEKGKAAEASTLVNSAMKNTNGSAMFYWYYLLYNFQKYGNQMSPTLKDSIKAAFTTYGGGVGGATENHAIMYATAFYLAHEAWPTATFNHPSFGAGDPNGKQKLLDWMHYTVKKGYLESDCFYYDIFYVNCMAMIAEFSKDRLTAHKASMTLDWILLNAAGQWLKGHRVATYQRGTNHLRNFESPYEPGMTTIGYWLYFGGADTLVLPLDNTYDSAPLGKAILNAVSSYRMPSIIEKIATDRTEPFLHKETHVKDGGALGAARAWYRSSYITSDYGIAGQKDLSGNSTEGFAAALVRWQVKWLSASPMSTFYINQPTNLYAGTSMYEEIFHHKKSLIGVCKIPRTVNYPYLQSYTSKRSIHHTVEKSDGWVLMHGGTVLIAVKFAKGYYWAPEDSVFRYMRSDSLSNAYAVETALPSAYPGANTTAQLEAFYTEIIQRTRFEYSLARDSLPTLRYVNLDGDTLKLTYTADRYGDYTLNGAKLEYHITWPLIENPWCFQKDNDPILRFWYGTDTLRYDFNNWSIAQSGTAKPDLVALRLTASPAQISAGTAVTFSAYVRNAGNISTPATPFSVSFLVQRADGTWADAASAAVMRVLAPGESLLVTGTQTYIPLRNGIMNIQMVVDGNNAISEAVKSNNTLTASFVVARPNLAQGKTVIVGGIEIPRLTDGDPWGTWTSAALPETLVVDLKSVVSVDQIVVKLPPNWATPRNMTYSIEGSDNGTMYTGLAASRSYSFAGNVMTSSVEFNSAKIRYIRIIVTEYKVGGNAQTSVVMSEIEAFGPETPTPAVVRKALPNPSLVNIRINGQLFSVPTPVPSESLKVSLYSLRGRRLISTLLTESTTGSITIPVNVAPGSYLCVITDSTKKKRSAHRLVVRH